MTGRPTVAVVGAGLAGLSVASALAGDHRVTVLDRLPAPGGVLGYDHPAVVEVARDCRAGGVTSLLGTTALRWAKHRLLAAGPQGIEWLPADHLVFAGGARPALPAELGLLGPRVAGVYGAPVAIHLGEAGVSMGREVCVVGVGDWAARAIHHLTHAGAHVTGVSPADGDPPPYGDGWWMGWRAVAYEGVRRVTAVVVARGASRERITCDTLVLAGDSRPLRNVDGAITPTAGVTFAQRISDAQTIEEVRDDSLAIANRIRDTQGSAAR
ncbi:MAG TPA: NAD-binding protein [Candidatus Sulfotelmatobacter sp.]|nr:NAD-binding protein [Candidatus Sulfotelmatobacter sp.]